MAVKAKSKDNHVSTSAAYHKGSWSYRKSSHQDECAEKKIWPFKTSACESAELKEVLLFSLNSKSPRILDPEKAQHLRTLSWKALNDQLNQLARVFVKNGVQVRRLNSKNFFFDKPNLMFCRDQFFMTPWGAIIARMASPVRAGEEKWAQLDLAEAGVPILKTISGRGLFEGADALWLSSHEVLIGTGNRTNAEAVRQIQMVLREFGVKVMAVKMPKTVQHLLGLLQIVAPKKCLLRTDIAGKQIRKILLRAKYEIVDVPESSEVRDHQGMNVVVLKPNLVLMPSNCPKLKELYRKNKITVAAEVEISELLNAAGGIACATGILSRE